VPGNDTHAAAGGAGAAVVCAALALPVVWWAIPIAAASIASPWPDRLEKAPRALWRRVRKRQARHVERKGKPSRLYDRLDRRLRKLQVHRSWTHWLSVGLAIALLLGVLTFGAIVGVGFIGVTLAEHAGSDAAMPTQVWTVAAWGGMFASLGVFIGCALHSFLDGFTMLGSPMLGPWRRERLHIVDKPHWIDDGDEAKLRKLCPVVIVGSVAAHYYSDLAPLITAIYHAVA